MKQVHGNSICRAATGLTLIELLVVIAVITILAALLLPALRHGKNQVAKTTDLNNLHQVMIALHAYSNDSRDVLTWPNWDYGHAMPDGTARAGWLYKLNLSVQGHGAFVEQSSLLWDSLRQPRIFLCPMDQPDVPGRKQQLSSYIMNGAVIGFRSGYFSNATPVKISEMLPTDCLLFEADEQDPSDFNDGSSWPSEGVTARHLGGATQAAIDGSASYVSDVDWQNEVDYANKNRLWCYPKTGDGGDPVYGHVN
ncbi:MAG: prepilin-type N-terminal cleavage/methylation domain-containing protein [Verrucomicrobiota bacterium]